MKVKIQVYHPIKLITLLRDKYKEQWSTTALRWLVEHQRCKVNGFVERFCSMNLKKGDVVEITLEEPPQTTEIPRLFEDDNLLVVNKPAYITSEQVAEKLGLRLVHRLDRDTTGVMLLAKNETTENELVSLFRKREIKKNYLAFVSTSPKKRGGVIKEPIKGKPAVTSWSLIKRYKGGALLRCHPITGRTHQLRIHLLSIGCPIMGDVTYGGRLQTTTRPLLHAERISFNNRSFEAPLPPDMENELC